MKRVDIIQCFACTSVYVWPVGEGKKRCPACQEKYLPGDEVFEDESLQMAAMFIQDVQKGLPEALAFLPYKGSLVV